MVEGEERFGEGGGGSVVGWGAGGLGPGVGIRPRHSPHRLQTLFPPQEWVGGGREGGGPAERDVGASRGSIAETARLTGLCPVPQAGVAGKAGSRLSVLPSQGDPQPNSFLTNRSTITIRFTITRVPATE